MDPQREKALSWQDWEVQARCYIKVCVVTGLSFYAIVKGQHR